MAIEKSKKEVTKEKIQQAAYKCVAKYGFEKTTLEDIAKEVGLNKASLYYYYKSKEDIFLEVTSAETSKFFIALKLSTLQVQGIDNQLFHYLFERSVYYMKLIDTVHLSEETLRQVEPLFKAQIKETEQQEVTFLEGLIGQSKLKEINATMFAENLLAMCDGIKTRLRTRHTDDKNLEPLIEDIRVNLKFMLDLMLK
jgi:AcrR family transcriptional regulator